MKPVLKPNETKGLRAGFFWGIITRAVKCLFANASVKMKGTLT
jgi:hypothetical protein